MATLLLRAAQTARGVLTVTALLTVTLGQTPLLSEPAKVDGLFKLKAGNERFMKNATVASPPGAPSRDALAKAPEPFAMVLSCAETRVPPSYIFNAGPADLFVVSTAGQVVDKAVIATLEHGVERQHIPLLVVMGHDSCGAVSGAVEGTAPSSTNLQYLFKAIRQGTDRTAAERREIRDDVLANVEQVINDILAGSVPLRQASAAGTVQIVGAYFELASGRVMFSEPVGIKPATLTATPEAPEQKTPAPKAEHKTEHKGGHQ